jgi:signal transduction histidine kinase
MPRLSLFITGHSQEILAAWEAFARELPGAERMDVAALRGHAQSMLEFIVLDLETTETDAQRNRKSRGLLDAMRDAGSSAASTHGLGRARRGFGVQSIVAEFRALRASVIDLWVKQQTEAGPAELEEMRRFNEAIDQAIAESLAQHTEEIERARDRFLAVLGHDLRTPLTAIIASSRFMLDEDGLSTQERRHLIGGIERSGRRMSHLVDDLLDIALTRLGDMIPLHRERTDLGALVREIGAEVGAASPAAKIDVETSGTLIGEWDRTRLEQALANLLSNAVEHGSPGKPIKVSASGDGDRKVMIAVTNEGRVIPPDQISGLFGAMKGTAVDRSDHRHLGLGLYIVDKIVEAHGGSIDVRSSDEQGTTFRITIPRQLATAPSKANLFRST